MSKPAKPEFQDGYTNRVIITTPENTMSNLSINNMMSPLYVSNSSETTPIEQRDTEHPQLKKTRFRKHREEPLSPKRCKPNLLQPDSYHNGAKDGPFQYKVIWST